MRLSSVLVLCCFADTDNVSCSAKFAFKNPNIKDACGCGESFTVG